jgi:hypothetical protein
MSVQLNITADRPALVAEVYALLAEHLHTVSIDGDDVLFEFVIGDEATEDVLADEHAKAHADEPCAIDEPHHCEPEPEPEPVKGGTLRDHIVTLLRSQPNRTWTPGQVYEHIDDSTEGSIAQTLVWLTNNNQVQRVARGQYQAIDRTATHDARRQAAAAGMFSS